MWVGPAGPLPLSIVCRPSPQTGCHALLMAALRPSLPSLLPPIGLLPLSLSLPNMLSSSTGLDKGTLPVGNSSEFRGVGRLFLDIRILQAVGGNLEGTEVMMRTVQWAS